MRRRLRFCFSLIIAGSLIGLAVVSLSKSYRRAQIVVEKTPQALATIIDDNNARAVLLQWIDNERLEIQNSALSERHLVSRGGFEIQGVVFDKTVFHFDDDGELLWVDLQKGRSGIVLVRKGKNEYDEWVFRRAEPFFVYHQDQ